MRIAVALGCSCLFLLESLTARANPFEFDIDLAPAGVAVFGNLKKPGDSSGTALADVSSGVRARVDASFLVVEMSYQHFFGGKFDFVTAGAGVEFELSLPKTGKYESARVYWRATGGVLLMAAPVTVVQEDITTRSVQTEWGFRAAGDLGIDFALNEWFTAGVLWEVGLHFLGTLGFNVSLQGVAGVRF